MPGSEPKYGATGPFASLGNPKTPPSSPTSHADPLSEAAVTPVISAVGVAGAEMGVSLLWGLGCVAGCGMKRSAEPSELAVIRLFPARAMPAPGQFPLTNPSGIAGQAHTAG